MQEGYITVFFFLFPAVTRFVDFLTLIRGCVFMCLFARLGLRFLWSVAFWKPQISSMTEAQMAQCNPEVSLLITVRSHSHSVKAVGSKVLEWWFMSTISHAERMAWKHEEKNARANVLFWNSEDVTDASGFNGVEQVRKASHSATARCIMQHSLEPLFFSVTVFSPLPTFCHSSLFFPFFLDWNKQTFFLFSFFC